MTSSAPLMAAAWPTAAARKQRAPRRGRYSPGRAELKADRPPGGCASWARSAFHATDSTAWQARFRLVAVARARPLAARRPAPPRSTPAADDSIRRRERARARWTRCFGLLLHA